jgi:DNA-binding response OmpR family regulator
MEPRTLILLADNDPEILENTGDILSVYYQILCAREVSECVRMAEEKRPELILLNLDLPDGEGLKACAQLRQSPLTREISIIGMSAQTGPELRIQAYQEGVDDFIEKPFRVKEILARIRSKVRRIQEGRMTSTQIKYADLTLDCDRLEVRINDAPVPLSILEFNLLKFFVAHREKVLTREAILATVWSGAVVSGRTVDSHIVSLRKKMAGAKAALSTVYGAGYILKPIGTLAYRNGA